MTAIPFLRGKTAFISGAAKRIGHTTALSLADAGINLVIHYDHSEAEADETVREVRRKHVSAFALRGSLTDPAGVAVLFAQAVSLAGHIDFLINNASVFPVSQLSSFDLDELKNTLDINAVTPLMLSRAFAEQTDKGAIVNLLDSRIQRYDLSHSAYQLSKNMLRDITKMCAVEFAPRIRVNGVAPGLILPPPEKGSAYIESQQPRTLLEKHGSAEDIADAVLFLLGADFITGEIITVDGGENLKRMSYGGSDGI